MGISNFHILTSIFQIHFTHNANPTVSTSGFQVLRTVIWFSLVGWRGRLRSVFGFEFES